MNNQEVKLTGIYMQTLGETGQTFLFVFFVCSICSAGAGDLTGDPFGYVTGVLAVIIHASYLVLIQKTSVDSEHGPLTAQYAIAVMASPVRTVEQGINAAKASSVVFSFLFCHSFLSPLVLFSPSSLSVPRLSVLFFLVISLNFISSLYFSSSSLVIHQFSNFPSLSLWCLSLYLLYCYHSFYLYSVLFCLCVPPSFTFLSLASILCSYRPFSTTSLLPFSVF